MKLNKLLNVIPALSLVLVMCACTSGKTDTQAVRDTRAGAQETVTSMDSAVESELNTSSQKPNEVSETDASSKTLSELYDSSNRDDVFSTFSFSDGDISDIDSENWPSSAVSSKSNQGYIQSFPESSSDINGKKPVKHWASSYTNSELAAADEQFFISNRERTENVYQERHWIDRFTSEELANFDEDDFLHRGGLTDPFCPPFLIDLEKGSELYMLDEYRHMYKMTAGKEYEIKPVVTFVFQGLHKTPDIVYHKDYEIKCELYYNSVDENTVPVAEVIKKDDGNLYLKTNSAGYIQLTIEVEDPKLYYPCSDKNYYTREICKSYRFNIEAE